MRRNNKDHYLNSSVLLNVRVSILAECLEMILSMQKFPSPFHNPTIYSPKNLLGIRPITPTLILTFFIVPRSLLMSHGHVWVPLHLSRTYPILDYHFLLHHYSHFNL